jgi:NAD+ synthase (glutamine-hydrolysing)
MRLVEVAVASVDPTVGAVRSNRERVARLAREMAGRGATVGCFPEQVLGGYPPEDLVQWRAFVAAQSAELRRLAEETADLGMVLVVGLAVEVEALLFNAAAVVHRGEILGLVPKEKLPTYNVFYEGRTFARGGAGLALRSADGVPVGDYVFTFDFGTLAVEVCEDAWSPDGPMRRRCYSGAELVVNLSASPFRTGVDTTRREMLATRSADSQAALAYANAVGGQDGLIFDGGGYVFQNGRLLLAAPRFREGSAACTVDLDRTRCLRLENTTWRSDCEAFRREHPSVPALRAAHPGAERGHLTYPAPAGDSFFLPPAGTPVPAPRQQALDDLFEALALGVKDYFEKTGAFRSFGVAFSGGRDSLLTLLVAWRAVQLLRGADGGEPLRAAARELLCAFYMPTRHSADSTRAAAAAMCDELGIELRVVPIDEAWERELEATRAMLVGAEATPVTRQNVQARLRSLRMWNWANTSGGLFLQTGDMSEKAVGYTTIGGDLEGALSVIANVPKTVVVTLLERLHERFAFAGIAATLATAPGPELAPGQLAEEELMPFPVLDACLHLYAAEKLSPREVAQALRGIFPALPPPRLAEWALRFAELFTRSIYKWVQAPLALHVGSLELDRERALQLPVVQRREWQE